MNILLVLIPVRLALAGIAIWAFFWAANAGQFDDLDTPALHVLTDDPEPSRPHAAEPHAESEPPP